MNNVQESPTGEEQGITGITVQGFKSLYEESRIEVRPLTVLAGANSAGKSSIMQPLLMMKQTLEASYDPGGLLLSGANVKFTSYTQFLSLNKSGLKTQELDKDFSLKVDFAHQNNDACYFKNIFQQNSIGLGVAQTECGYSMSDHSIFAINYNLESSQEDIFNQIQKLKKWQTFGFPLPKSKDDIMLNINQFNYFLSLRCIMEQKSDVSENLPLSDHNITPESHSPIIRLFNSVYDNSIDIKILTNLIINIIHLPCLRNKPERMYPVSSIERFVGTFDHYFATRIHYWHTIHDSRLQKLNDYLQLLGLTSKITASRPNDVDIELQVGFSLNDDHTMVNLADVGVGVSQVLPVLVALLVAQPGQLVYLEQPELHLHPRAQANLAQPLVDAANRGVKVIVETHSDLLLTRIQTLVAEEKINYRKVIFHWFNRQENGVTQITSAELDSSGAYGDFPLDFSDVFFDEDSRYVRAVSSKLVLES
ncbi:MAG: AAA family ATPase [Merismopediaceae bacterium]|nr:AAA family ATPase [Merismopediaceae bacterium]